MVIGLLSVPLPLMRSIPLRVLAYISIRVTEVEPIYKPEWNCMYVCDYVRGRGGSKLLREVVWKAATRRPEAAADCLAATCLRRAEERRTEAIVSGGCGGGDGCCWVVVWNVVEMAWW